MSDELEIVIVPEPSTVAVPQPGIQVLIKEATSPVVIESPDIDVVVVDEDVHIVDTIHEMSVITVGEAGPAGADGVDAGGQIIKTAAVSIGGHRVVVPDSTGGVIYADASTLTHRDKVLGVTTGAASASASATIQTYGELTEPSWAWTLDEPVFLGLTGLLTQTPPSSGFLQRVGFPTAATKLFIDIDNAITL